MKTYVKYSLIAWLIFGTLVTWAFSHVSDIETALVRVLSFLVPQMFLFYLNLLWLSCKYLEQKKTIVYFGLLALLVAIHVFVFGQIDLAMDQKFPMHIQRFHERTMIAIYFGRFMSSLPPLIISALIWKSLLLSRKNKESLELRNKMLDAERKALRAQINPHFLFNSMNNIYSLSQMKSDKTGDAILQLSEILRFVTYESEKDKVSLQEELKQIKNFIELQFLKDDDQSNVKIEISSAPTHLQIAPMLLLPFIENSFKHSNFEDKVHGWIKISIQTEGDTLHMNITNSASLLGTKKDNTGGVGMENVKKRLQLIYPDKHKLNIKQDTEKYEVDLQLNLAE
ncbi:MAG: histidine kinase [Crocinitomicaceae bacterium]|nr:histidine kinase [Crocinitomicaceae bacterium]